MGVMKHQVFAMHEFAVKIERCHRIGKMGALHPAGADRRMRDPLVQPGNRLTGTADRQQQVAERQFFDIETH